jgi:hypothetical protein
VMFSSATTPKPSLVSAGFASHRTKMRSAIQTARSRYSSHPVFPIDDADQNKAIQPQCSYRFSVARMSYWHCSRYRINRGIGESIHGRHSVYFIGITKKPTPDKDLRRIGTCCSFFIHLIFCHFGL